MSNKPAYKIVLVGEAGVGKSSIVVRLVHDEFSGREPSTIGAAFVTHSLTFKNDNGEIVKKGVEIWDTAGEERYRCLVPMYFRGASAAIIVYDITNRASFEALQYWVGDLRSYTAGSSEVLIAIAGNKADLEDLRQVSSEEAARFAQDMGVLFFETSAKDANNVDELFETIAKTLPGGFEFSTRSTVVGSAVLSLPPASSKRKRSGLLSLC